MAKRIVIIQGIFHTKEMEIMLAAAQKKAAALGLDIVKVISVPGSMEVPIALHRALMRSDVDGAVVLGIIERGETGHGLVMGQSVIKSVIDQQVATNKPVGVGILGPDIFPSQIGPRIVGYAEAAVAAAAHMLELDL